MVYVVGFVFVLCDLCFVCVLTRRARALREAHRSKQDSLHTQQLLSPSSQTSCSCHSSHSVASLLLRLLRRPATAVDRADSLPRFRSSFRSFLLRHERLNLSPLATLVLFVCLSGVRCFPLCKKSEVCLTRWHTSSATNRGLPPQT